ncbi:MAG: hypothetical protein ACREN5_03405 [Gemmatimonadales bacterium]
MPGGRFADAWTTYRHATWPAILPAPQLLALREAFYAGASIAMLMATDHGQPGLADLLRELREYADQAKKRYLRRSRR